MLWQASLPHGTIFKGGVDPWRHQSHQRLPVGSLDPAEALPSCLQDSSWSMESVGAWGRHERMAKRAVRAASFFRSFQLKRHRPTTPEWQFSQPRSHGGMSVLQQSSWRWDHIWECCMLPDAAWCMNG